MLRRRNAIWLSPRNTICVNSFPEISFNAPYGGYVFINHDHGVYYGGAIDYSLSELVGVQGPDS